MTPDEHRELYEYAVANRERIGALERELERTRSAVHDLRGETQAIRYLAEKVGEMAADIHELTGRVETLARHAVRRPAQSTLAVVAQYLSVGVALTALVIAYSH